MTEIFSNIISGPELNDYDVVPEESIGKFMIDSLAKSSRDKIVFIDAVTKDTLTCGEFISNTLKCAAVFKDLGLKQNDVIAFVTENKIDYFVPVIAALYSGIIANLLNPNYTTGELEHAFCLSKPRIVICSKLSLKAVLEVTKNLDYVDEILVTDPDYKNGYGLNLKTLIRLQGEITTSELPAAEFDLKERGAFIMLSSGTTGLPKGVLLTHENLRAAFISSKDDNFSRYLANDILLHMLPFCHIYGLMVYLLAASRSLKIIMLGKFKPEDFLRSIQEYKVTKLATVPSVLLFMVKSPLVKNYNLCSILDVLISGAPTNEKLQQEAENIFFNAQLRQLYGATETCGACTYQTVNCKKQLGVGYLTPGMQIKVLNSESNQTVGVYQRGELCFRGEQIMKEYVNNKTATQESIDQDGFYHTGDLGYYDEDGNIFIEARLKELIKYKGFQVSPAELEALILTNSKVKDCGVVGVPNERCGQLPVAFVVKHSNHTDITEEEIIKFVAERISIQKHLHGGVRFIDAVPKNSNGKIIRSKLLELLKN